MSSTVRFLKRIGVVLLGTVLIVTGVVMLVTPGPGIVAIVAGLAVLGTEFERPRRWVAHLRDRFNLKRSSPDEQPRTPPPVSTSPSD